MITTITQPDSGSILFEGEPLREEHARQMGYMPEERGLYKKMTVWDQLLFFAEIKGMPAKLAKESATYWLNRLGLQTWTKKKLEELSKGMAQKVQFLCTIIHKPRFIILDEPFSGFDPVNADLIKDLIIELNKNGATILFSTHRMDNVEELCDYLCIIDHGKMMLDGDAGGLRRRMFKNEYDVAYLSEQNFSGKSFQPSSTSKTTDGRHMYTFQLNGSDQRENLLQQCVSLPGLVYFGEALPTIHQIFVDTVTNHTNE